MLKSAGLTNVLYQFYYRQWTFFGGKYLELKPNEFLKYTDKFDDPNLPGEMMTSVWIKKVSAGKKIS
jgi:uncharacterized protein YndB with AHSA1/START domain